MKSIRVVASLLLLITGTILAAEPGYYRFPAIHGDRIVFTAEGDLWIVNAQGGVARRLTSAPGVESNAAISPDGKTIAFSASYEGPREVYTMPSDGGLPVRRTFEGENTTVVGWTPDGRILYATGHYSTLPDAQLATFNLSTNSSELIPLSQASDGSYDPSQKQLCFTRYPFQGSHTKRYQGGTAQNIWMYDTGAPEAVPLTADFPGTSKNPMWWNGRIYFVTDRDSTMNLWSMDPQGKDLRQLTFHKGFDVKSPSLDNGRIAYQIGADIHVYDIAASTDKLVPITLSSDFDQMREKWVTKPMDYLTSVNVSPDGDRIVLTARGQVFVAPAQQGRFVRATSDDNVRYRNAQFMPDGKSLLTLSDESGELEFWKIPANGIGSASQISKDGTIFRYDGIPSPDGAWIASNDKNNKLWIHNVATGKAVLVATSESGPPDNLAWSPDSKWLAYSIGVANDFSRIAIYSIKDNTNTYVTDDRVDSDNPVWSPDGKWMYFLSDRQFESLVSSPWGARQPEPFFDRTTKIYAMALTPDLRFPFAPNDELMAEKQGKSEKEKGKGEDKEKKNENKSVSVTIDLNRIGERVYEVPVAAGNYRALTMNEKYLFWLERPVGTDSKVKLGALEIKNKEITTKTVMEDVRTYRLTPDGKKLMVQKGQDFYVFDAGASAPSDLGGAKVNLSAWKFTVDPRIEWRQMFKEAWRLERDYFYDPHLHGVDYKEILNRHLPLVDRVTDRDELNDLIADVVSELSALHTFVVGGDVRRGQDPIELASLGAMLARDEKAGGYRIVHIYRSEPDNIDERSPLARPGINLHDGDVIEAINGTPTLSVPSADLLLRNQTNEQVLLKVRRSGASASSEVIVKPISAGTARNLRYDDWEYSRRMEVESKGKGEIGYVHLRAMGGGDYTSWVENFYPVFNRQGLIVDVRHNRGGNIDSWILEKLLRKAWFYWKGRVGHPTWNMQYAFRGHVVVLCDAFTASDGEAFTEGFKRLGLGKVIGTRTWGGEIWLSFSNFLVDRGIASAAETGVYGPDGQWLIEGHGVDPDIIVDNLPHATYGGSDAQLDAAIDYLQQQIKLKPVETPPPPKYPFKAVEGR